MKVLLLGMLFIINMFNGYSQNNKTLNWNSSIQPILEVLYIDKKMYFYDYYIIERNLNSAVYNYLEEEYGITYEDWNKIYTIWYNNTGYHSDWNGGFSSEIRHKHTDSKKFAKDKIAVISVSRPIFIDTSTYLVSITQYCRGLCSSTDLYIIERTSDNVIEIKRKFNIAVS